MLCNVNLFTLLFAASAFNNIVFFCQADYVRKEITARAIRVQDLYG